MNSLRISSPDAPLLSCFSYTQGHFPTGTQHNHQNQETKLTQIHYYHRILRLHSSFTNYRNCVFYPKRIQSRVTLAFSYVCLVSFCLEKQLLRLFLVFMTLTLWKITDAVGCPSVKVCLMFPRGLCRLTVTLHSSPRPLPRAHHLVCSCAKDGPFDHVTKRIT